MTRFRSRQIWGPGGTITDHTGSFTTNYVVTDERVWDELSLSDCQPFTVVKSTYEGGIINRNSSTPGVVNFDNYVCEWVRGRDAYARLTSGSLPQSMGAYATMLRARTNPNRVSADTFSSIGETRYVEGLPDMLRQEGEHIIKKAAGRYLQWTFAIAPLVSDLVKMVDLAKLAQQRYAELERLRSKGLRRTINLDNVLFSETTGQTMLNSYGLAVSGRLEKTSRHVIRGHARWAGGHLWNLNTPEDRYRAAVNAVAGTTVDFATAWNMVPWSWLVDWFGNIGNILEGYRNSIPVSLDTSVLMYRYDTVTTSKDVQLPEGASMTPIKCSHTYKSRFYANAGIEFTVPFLRGQQLAVLGSLLAVRKL